MATATDIVTAALRKIGVASRDESPEGHDLAEGLRTLNQMMHGWKLSGVDLEHTDLDGGDTFPLAAEYEEGAIYCLAARLSPDYMVPQGFDADDWFRRIQAAYMQIEAAELDLAIRKPPSYYTPSQVRGRARYDG